MKSVINEIVGTFARPPQNPPTYQSPSVSGNITFRPPDIRYTGPNVRNCRTLENWQEKIVESLRFGSDQYIIARPGGGKTLPIICFWTDVLLDLNTRMLDTRSIAEKRYLDKFRILFSQQPKIGLPKILILVPVITLAQQTATEIRNDLASILLQIYNGCPDYVLRNFLWNYRPGNFRIGYYLNQYNEISNKIVRGAGNNTPALQNALENINRNLKSEVEACISDMVNRMVYLKTGHSNPQTDINEAIVFVSIYESAPSFIDKIDNLQLVVVDEAHLAQQTGNIYDDDSRAYQICGSLFKVFNTIRNNLRCRLAFLSGTINPNSARNLTQYLNRCFDRRFPDQPSLAPPEAANRSTLTVIKNNSISTFDGIVNNIVRSIKQRDWGQLYVLFSANKINSIVEECLKRIGVKNIESLSAGGYEPDRTFQNLGSHRSENRSLNINTSPDKLGIPPGMHLQVANITNPLLRQAVLRGIGFIYRNIPGSSPDKRMEMNDQDKIIVAKLFRERKLNVLLATDAVGIGVNIDVKDLYIPEVEKYNEKARENIKIALRDLSQILNRAGRGVTPIASIHTTEQNVEYITNALFSGPDDLPNVDAITDTSLCGNKEYFIKILRNLVKGG